MLASQGSAKFRECCMHELLQNSAALFRHGILGGIEILAILWHFWIISMLGHVPNSGHTYCFSLQIWIFKSPRINAYMRILSIYIYVYILFRKFKYSSLRTKTAILSRIRSSQIWPLSMVLLIHRSENPRYKNESDSWLFAREWK